MKLEMKQKPATVLIYRRCYLKLTVARSFVSITNNSSRAHWIKFVISNKYISEIFFSSIIMTKMISPIAEKVKRNLFHSKKIKIYCLHSRQLRTSRFDYLKYSW